MYTKSTRTNQQSLFVDLESRHNHKQPLYLLADKIDWLVGKLFCKRAGIDLVIGHLKADHRLCRNFYAGVFVDNINVMLAAAEFNFKREMRILFALLRSLFSLSLYDMLYELISQPRECQPAVAVSVRGF